LSDQGLDFGSRSRDSAAGLMYCQCRKNMKEELLDILYSTERFWPVSDLRRKLAGRGCHALDHELLGTLRVLLREGRVEQWAGRWRGVGIGSEGPTKGATSIAMPMLSRETLQLLGQARTVPPVSPSGPPDDETSITPESDEHPPVDFAGPWGQFRALLGYYRDCIRNEGGAEAMVRLDDLHAKFLFLSRIGSWLPRPGGPWRYSVPLGSHLGPLVQQLSGARQDVLLVLGYPLQVVRFRREGEPDAFLLKPVFHYPLEHTLSQGALVLWTESVHPQVNLDWLHHNFANTEHRGAFLTACGFIGTNDNTTSEKRLGPALRHLTATLAAFRSQELREILLPESIPDIPLRPPLDAGIYNRAVVMVARRPQYTRTLLRELAAILDTPDSELDRTALRFLFRSGEQKSTPASFEETGAVQAADLAPLNSEQRSAVEALLNTPITVITGPPGTGKSQVVSTAIANAHLSGKSVLFSSRNHKAIDAVHIRCRDADGRPLLVRCNSRDDPSLRATFATGIGQLLAGQADATAAEEATTLRADLRRLLDERAGKLRQADVCSNCRAGLGELEEKRSWLALKLPEAAIATLQDKAASFPAKPLDVLEKTALSLSSSGHSYVSWVASLAAMPAWVCLRRYLRRIPDLPGPPGVLCTPPRLATFSCHLSLLRYAAAFCACQKAIDPLEKEVRAFPDEAALASDIANQSKEITDISFKMLERLEAARSGLFSHDDRELFANLRSALGFLEQGTAPTSLKQDVKETLQSQLPKLLEHLPAWAVTSLSVGSRIPLLPGIFDLVVIDEASQSDIPSAIPLLFRARRAGVVGDPQQLTYVTNLSLAKDAMLRRRAGLDQLDRQRFSYVESSLYSLFADTNGVTPILLCETFRSVEEISEYSNELFYGGRLRVATDLSRLAAIPGMKTGIHWTEIVGEVRGGGAGGAYCVEEIAKVSELARGILADGTFQGSLGIITPFREQANRLRDGIHNGEIPWGALRAANVVVDTSHGFQGDERDVILFSLCAGPEMPSGALHFLRETANLFNVAISRARAVVRVVGNRSWARTCGIRHIERLTAPPWTVLHPPSAGPWAPHESPWEKRLAEALTASGLSPIPQHPVAGRRLDIALIRNEPQPLKIDIEVDGACCHRNPDGTRKIDDIWRDIQLQGLGWRVLRFWVYQLREDMAGCVSRIMEVWNHYE